MFKSIIFKKLIRKVYKTGNFTKLVIINQNIKKGR